jgi:membrane protease subunit HflC
VLFRNGLQRAGELDPAAPRPLIVVSNREPYLHNYDKDGGISYSSATGGVAVALDALMRERGGIWIAHGAGSADRAVVDASDKVRVPPQSPSYQLRRLWFEEKEFAAYYGGFANEGLWPLCHLVDVRPTFRPEDWAAYQSINAKFAAAIDQELTTADTPVFIQDYHLALVAPRLRERRSGARTALFWHIPWPYPDRLCICPWHREILAGLVANDLLAFQLERDRRNFLLAMEELGAEIEADGARVHFNSHSTTVLSVPIGVDYDRIQAVAQDPALVAERQRLTGAFDLRAPILGIGVDRLDYTKGIPERLAAIDGVLTRRPDLRGFSATYVVGETDQVIITQFGEPVGQPVITPGLHFKLPFMQQVNYFDKRFLEWDGSPNQIPTRDKRFIWVDSYARWRISNPLLFFQRVRDELGAQSRLDDILDGETRNAIARNNLVEVVRSTNREPENVPVESEEEISVLEKIQSGRSAITREILATTSPRVAEFGIELLDFRFKRINYVEQVQNDVFARMIAERKRIAERYRSEGEGEAARISGERERDLQRIQSEAYRKAQETRGKADAESTRVYADAHNRDASFYAFTKSLEAYEKAVDPKTILILSTEGELLRYFERSR